MKKALLIIAGILAVLVALIVTAPYFVSEDVFRKSITTQLEKTLGRRVDIKGKFSLRFFPSAGATLENVSIAGNDPALPLLTLKSLDIDVAMADMVINHEVVIKHLHLDSPQINLVVDPSGKGNWEKANVNLLAPNGAAAPRNVKLSLPKFSMDEMVISKGVVHYDNQQSKTQWTLDALEINASLDPKSTALKAGGSMRWNQKPLSLKAGIGDLQHFIIGTSLAITLQVKSDLIFLDTTGALDNLIYTGHLKMSAPSIKTLVLQMKDVKYLDDIKPKLQLDADGDVQCTLIGCHYSKASITLDDIKAKGDINVALDNRPSVDVNLTADEVDLNPYLPTATTPSAAVFSANPRSRPMRWLTSATQ